MEETAHRAIAIVGTGAMLPDALNTAAFWENVKTSRYSITEVPQGRWNPEFYYDADPKAPDKTYSKIGGWVREFHWDPVKWKLPIPPRVAQAMDDAQRWAVACTREALQDYGHPQRALDLDRTAVILGNSMAGEKHYLTSLRIFFPEFAHHLEESSSFTVLPEALRREIRRELHQRVGKHLPEVTEDSMPGELANCLAGRIANLFGFHGPNYVCDAACASAMAAISAAAEGLIHGEYDAVITGGVDRNMGAPTFVKFCKIGALSATGSRPFATGADGFVMGEGAAIFLMKRLADAERDGDKVYAVLRGLGGSSDGKGKGITAPNPIGQKFAIERAWKSAGLSPATATLIEGHGTSTRVGDSVEVQSLTSMLSALNLPTGAIALGSVKSNIGHLKGGAGAAGLLKVALALRDKVLPPSLNCERPNPEIDFAHSPLYVNTSLRPWDVREGEVRRAGLSAFGFGGTNFHAVLEEHIPGRLNGNGKKMVAIPEIATLAAPEAKPDAKNARDGYTSPGPSKRSYKTPLRGALVIGAASAAELAERTRAVQKAAQEGSAPPPAAPAQSELLAHERLAIDYGDAKELAAKSAAALKGLAAEQPAVWKVLRAQGIFRGHGPAPKVAFLYTGQGSQYVNMLRSIRAQEPIVAETFAEADRIMTPLLGKPLTEFIFVDPDDRQAVAKAEEDLRQTEITQPAVMAVAAAITKLLAAYGITPDFTMGHSVGEYGALIGAGALPFEDAMEAVSTRGREMAHLSVADKGMMAAVFAPLVEVERTLKSMEGYVVIANINSEHQTVIGGASEAVKKAAAVFQHEGYDVAIMPVSHAFHTSIVAPASAPLRRMLARLRLQSPVNPIVANVTGEFYPTGEEVVPQMLDLLATQVAAPVQFVKGLRTLYDAGARVFVEVGPKKALQGFVEDVLGKYTDVVPLVTNYPKSGDFPSFNQALCGLYAAGLGNGILDGLEEISVKTEAAVKASLHQSPAAAAVAPKMAPAADSHSSGYGNRSEQPDSRFADELERGGQIDRGKEKPRGNSPVAITGVALGLPGTPRIFDEENLARILSGEQFIDLIPSRFRRLIADKHITRLVKSENDVPVFEKIDSVADVIKLAGRGGAFDLEKEYGVSAERIAAFDRVTQLAIAVGVDALRDAGIPLVLRYITTSKGTHLPDRWVLPESLRDGTGVVFASAFPGYDSYAEDMGRYWADRNRREQLTMLESLQARLSGDNSSILAQEIDRRMDELRNAIEKSPYLFDRRFLFRVLSMGHSQFAEFIGARGPNTAVNAACASATQALVLAEDWIHAGRCQRVIVVSADDITSNNMIEWFGAGFLSTGAAATEEVREDVATPFDRRRHGLVIGMGAAALVVESAESAKERGLQPICEVLGAVTSNSAFHGTRLDLHHIAQVMEELITKAEERHHIRRLEIAPRTVFVSHETYTPARGGSASAEIHALRKVFGEAAGKIVIANTKGLTGHTMGCGIEDVVAVRALETGCVPPVTNFKEVDPELGQLNLSKGGIYPVDYALRLAAGYGSQISLTLLRLTAQGNGARPRPNALGYAYRIADREAWQAWLKRISAHTDADLEVVHRTLRVRDQGSTLQVKEDGTAAFQTTFSGPLAAAPPVQPTPAVEEVKEKVLALVAEKTGYPAEMLDLDLDLEADLGVDTVKQAEIFAAIREVYGIARDESLKLRDLPTLAHVIRFVHERRPDLGGKPAEALAPMQAAVLAPAAVASATASTDGEDAVKQRILAMVIEKTGYPADMLDLDLDLEADLGVDTVKQAEIFAAIREIYNIPRDENRKLREYPTLRDVIRFVLKMRPDLAGSSAAEKSAAPEEGLEAPTPAAAVAPSEALAAVAAPGLIPVDGIQEKILAIVAEKTGYPSEMLDPGLDLEADLGIDTVKQAEIFASVRAAFNIPRDESLKLRDFPTLNHVMRLARERQPGAAGEVLPAPTQRPAEVASAVSETAHIARPEPASLDAADRVPRRVPGPILRPPLAICKPTGVRIEPGSRIVVMPDQGGVGEVLAERLRKLGAEVFILKDAPPADELVNRLDGWLASRPIHGVYWLPALDEEGPITAMDTAAWQEAVRVRVKLLFTTMKHLYEQIEKPGTFLVSATRFGGQHGYGESGASAPLGGAVSGFCKTYKRERPNALVKAVDFEPESASAGIAELLIEEALRDPGAVEIGYKEGLRWTVGVRELPADDGQPGLTLDRKTVFLITGAAGGIVSAITADLAASSGGTFYLLDMAPQPDPNNRNIQRLVNDKENLKRDLFAQIQARGERATPALVEKELAALERAQAALSAIEAVRAAGGAAHYCCVNLTDGEGVSKVVERIRQEHGRIDVLLHAAGLERSHPLPAKDEREFDLVFDVKSDGFYHLLRAIGDMPLGASVVFSSVVGRFGNHGQADYSSANDLLCKITSSMRRTHPKTAAIAIDWTAWGGIGMATRASIPKIMEEAGIDMLQPQAGIPIIRRELTAGGTRGEIVIGERLGVLLNEWDETGGFDPAAERIQEKRTPGPMAGKIVRLGVHSGFTFETTLDPKEQSFLFDHQIDGIPVLPGVMGLEAFAEAALHLLPGWRVEAVENVDYLAPFKFYRNEPRTVTIVAAISPQEAGLVAECRLLGSRLLANQSEPQVTEHFSARVRLTKLPPTTVSQPALEQLTGKVIEAKEIYRLYFHGPAYQVVKRAWWDGRRMISLKAKGSRNNHHPSEQPTVLAPQLIELCFQTAGLWEMGVQGRMGLPRQIDRVTFNRMENGAAHDLYAVVTPRSADGRFDGDVVDTKGNCYLQLRGYGTIAVPGALEEKPLKALQSLLTGQAVSAA